MADQNKRHIGEIYLIDGIGKESKKPYTALILEVGTWSKMYFPDSRFEMDYIKSFEEQTEFEEGDKIQVNGKG